MPKLASILILHNFSMFSNFQDQPEKKMKIVWASSESWNWLNGWNHICLLKNFFNETKINATATNFLKFVKSWLIIETRLAKYSRILWMKCSMRHLMKQGNVFHLFTVGFSINYFMIILEDSRIAFLSRIALH